MNQTGKIREWVFIIAGTGLFAFAVQSILDPQGMVIGGFTGIAMIVKELSGRWEMEIPMGVTTAVLNMPLFLFAWRRMGWHYIKRSFVATMLVSIWLFVLPVLPMTRGDMVLTALFGGLLTGVGLGLVIRCKASTGGTDMLAAVIRPLFPGLSLVQIFHGMDAIIVILGAWIFGVPMALYAIAALYVSGKVSDGIISGGNYAKVALIITDRWQQVAQSVMEQMHRGVTGLFSQGMYTKQHRRTLLCVVGKKEVVILKSIIARTDPSAFVMVTDVREVLGEGFSSQIGSN